MLYCVTVIQFSVWWPVIYTIKALGWERGIIRYSGIFDLRHLWHSFYFSCDCVFVPLALWKRLCAAYYSYFHGWFCFPAAITLNSTAAGIQWRTNSKEYWQMACVCMYRWAGAYYSKPWGQTPAKHGVVLGKGKQPLSTVLSVKLEGWYLIGLTKSWLSLYWTVKGSKCDPHFHCCGIIPLCFVTLTIFIANLRPDKVWMKKAAGIQT